MVQPKRLVVRLLAFAILAAALNAAFQFGHVLVLEARGAIHPDGIVYLMVGRGILNGLLPYVDLFESKPPGMYFISILALLLANNDRGALFLQIAVLTAIPLLLTGFAIRSVRDEDDTLRRYAVIATAIVLGTLLALQLEECSGGFQTESFGAFFASCYLLHVFVRSEATKISAILVNATLLLAAVGTKEPFVLTTLAGALLLARDWRHFFQTFVIPLALAVVLGIGLMAALGYLGPYLTAYLPAILHYRISSDVLEPLWIRGFAVGRVFFNLARFFPSVGFGAVFGFLWLVAPALKTQQASWPAVLLTIATSAVAYTFMIETRVLLVVLRAMWLEPVSFSGAGVFIFTHVGAYVLLVILLVALLILGRKRELTVPTLLGCTALYLTSAAVGVANYQAWHQGFAFPLLFALALLFLRYVAWSSPWGMAILPAVLACVVTALLFRPDPPHLRTLADWTNYDSSKVNAPIAAHFDELVERCHIDAYFLHNAEIPLAFSHHSPLGPIFVLRDFTPILPANHPLFAQTYANILNKAQLIVVGSGSRLDDILPNLAATFTAQPPACAGGLLPLDHLSMFFRKS